MEKEVVKKLYIKYLKEIFDIDKLDLEKQNYILHDGSRSAYFINPHTLEIFKYDIAIKLPNGFIKVKKDDRENILDCNGNLLSREWFTKVSDYKEGFATVTRDNLTNFIDENGNFLFSVWKKNVSKVLGFFPCGILVIGYKDGRCSLVDKDGEEKFIDNELEIDEFIGKYAVARKKKVNSPNSFHREYEYYILESNGQSIKTNYSFLKQIDEGLFVASNSNPLFNKNEAKLFLVDSKGNRIGNILFDSVENFQVENDHIVIKNNEKYNLLSRTGKLLSNEWFSKIKKYNDEYWIVNKDGKYNLLSKEGILLSEKWFDSIDVIFNKVAVAKLDSRFYHINEEGILSNEFYKTFEESLSALQKYVLEHFQKERPTIIPIQNMQFEVVNYQFQDGTKVFEQDNNNFVKMENGFFAKIDNGKVTLYDNKARCLTSLDVSGINLYHVSELSLDIVDDSKVLHRVNAYKKWGHFKYNAMSGRKYILDYRPLVDYGNIIICESSDMYYAYSKSHFNVIPIGYKGEITLGKNYVQIGEKRYYISGLDFIDITDISFENRIDKKDGIDNIMTLDEFSKLCEQPNYQERIAGEIVEVRNIVEQEQAEKIKKGLNDKREQERQVLKEKQERLNKSLSDLSNLLEECSKYITEIQNLSSRNSSDKIIVPISLLFIESIDHLEINPMFLMPGILKYINLSIVSFDNVKVSGLDLSYTDARINPQTVYNKDMSNGKYCGLDFNLCSFDGVNIENADFKDAITDFSTDFENESKGKI